MGLRLVSWLSRLLSWVATGPQDDVAVQSVVSQHPEAERIIVARDNLNAILYEKYGAKVFLVHEERAILHLFKDCRDEVDFGYRVGALGMLLGTLNEALLRRVSGSAETGSINLLRDFLGRVAPNTSVSAQIQVLRDLVSIRNMFPIHRDNAGNAMAACGRLGIGYPITDFRRAWTALLAKYAGVLTDILEVVANLPSNP
jgi:hypothetical protein